MTPGSQLTKLIERVVVPYATLPKVHLFDDISGTMANDFALKAAFIKHHERVTGKVLDYYNIWEEVKAPRPDYKVVAFKGSHFGTSLATLSASTHHQKFNVPNYPFLLCDFPHSKDLEQQAIDQFSKTLDSNRDKIAAVII